MRDHHPGGTENDGGLADPASSHGSDLDPRVGDDQDEEEGPAQAEGADETGP
jgi:hypothetical protein